MAQTPATESGTAKGPHRHGARAFVVAVSAVLALVACSSEPPSAADPSESTAGVTGTITVFAAASLTDAFEEIAEDFEVANPGAEVEFNFAASSALATQINEGAPADVFASASPATMATVADGGNAVTTNGVLHDLVLEVVGDRS